MMLTDPKMVFLDGLQVQKEFAFKREQLALLGLCALFWAKLIGWFLTT